MDRPFRSATKNDNLREAMRRKEMHAERQINRIRALSGPVLVAADQALFFGSDSMRMALPWVAGFLVLFLAYCYLVHRFTAARTYRPWLKFVTIAVDFALVLAFFTLARLTRASDAIFNPQGQVAALSMVMLILIIVGTLRFSASAIVFAGALSLAGTVWAVMQVGEGQVLAAFACVVMVLMTLLALYFSRSIYDLFLRVQYREALTRFLSPQVVERIDSGEITLAPGGEEREVTLLLVDIRGFTRLCEALPAPRLVELLNHYLERMTNAVFHNGGTLDKFIGDAVLAVFGAPIGQADDAHRALRAASAMLEGLEQMNRELSRQGFEPLRIGAALHSGRVVAGTIGSQQRLEYTVIGEPVNLVSRIEELNKQYGTVLLMSEDTHARVSGVFQGECMGTTAIRGSDRHVTLYGRREAVLMT